VQSCGEVQSSDSCSRERLFGLSVARLSAVGGSGRSISTHGSRQAPPSAGTTGENVFW
jgi:hypothetical protein